MGGVGGRVRRGGEYGRGWGGPGWKEGKNEGGGSARMWGGGGTVSMGDGQNEERILNENLIISNNTNRQLVSYWLVL